MGLCTAYLGVGSNIEPEQHIRAALKALAGQFENLAVSPVYRCAAVGFDGPEFLNLVVSVDCQLNANALKDQLTRIELANGRQRQAQRFTDRTLDIDLLMLGAQVLELPGLSIPRDEILKYAFVLRPLAELAPALVHPLEGKTMAQLWQDFSGNKAGLSRASIKGSDSEK